MMSCVIFARPAVSSPLRIPGHQHLGMHIDGVLDPFVERLLEGSAFLCTRIQEKLNNEQPEFALQMLSRPAPLWYTPVPAIATVAIKPDLFSPVAQPLTCRAGAE